MGWFFSRSCTTKAQRRYTRRILVVMGFYMATVYRVTWMVHRHPPQGWKLYLEAALPTIPVLAMMAVIGLYLREEIDEFKRLQVVRSMLVGIAATFAVSTFADFLRSYHEGQRDLPPFTLFSIFFLAMGLSQAVQAMQNRVSSDD